MTVKRSASAPKAPFMEVLDTLSHSLTSNTHSHSNTSNVSNLSNLSNTLSTEDCRVLIDNYPHLMQCYEEDLKSIYTAAEEACCRIISNTLLPDLSDLAHISDVNTNNNNNYHDHLPLQVKRSFFSAIKEMQASGVPSVQRGALPKNAVAKFKQWFDINIDYPCTYIYICIY